MLYIAQVVGNGNNLIGRGRRASRVAGLASVDTFSFVALRKERELLVMWSDMTLRRRAEEKC